MGRDDDESEFWGQNDGDESGVGFSGAVQFQASGAGQPWLKSGIEPWHMWGTTQTVSQGPIAPVPGITGASHTLARVIYKRPETWHWVFSARLIAAQTVGVGDSVSIQIFFDLIVGVGRSNIRIPAFQTLSISYDGPPLEAPIGEHVYSTKGDAFTTFDRTGGVITRTPEVITEITAQDITCSARIEARMGGGVPITSPVVMELSAHFSPKNHIRPDWFQAPQVPPEAKFPGSELGGS